VAEPNLHVLNLDVYDTKDGLWNPDHGSVELPEDWEFLPAGDTFVTRRVKAAGAYWNAWRPRGRNRQHRRKLGLFAPTGAIEAARADADATTTRRARQREDSARQRAKSEDAYREAFAAAALAWLDFTAEHAALAEHIATTAAERAVVVGSGRVGRTKLLPLEERAALAARATIRHEFTDYDDRLVELDPFETDVDDVDYRALKQAAHDAVDEFLLAHRRSGDVTRPDG
jgi:Uncharacterized conserved protein (DUF2293)